MQVLAASLACFLLVCAVLFLYYSVDGKMGIAFAPRYALTRLRIQITKALSFHGLLGGMKAIRGMQRDGFRRNCLAPHTPLALHYNHSAALQDPRDFGRRSPWKMLLDHEDEWEFILEPMRGTHRAKTFVIGGHVAHMHRVPVPSSWQMQGFQPPLYTNFEYPFGVNYPYLQGDNPCGYYRRKFIVPPRWVQEYRRIRLCISAAGPDVEVYINGTSVGYSQDSMTPSEFEISNLVYQNVENGSYENTIVLEVSRFAEGSWLEDQDHWWFSGVHRSVEIFAMPQVHICDYAVTTKFVKEDEDGHQGTPLRSLTENLLAKDEHEKEIIRSKSVESTPSKSSPSRLTSPSGRVSSPSGSVASQKSVGRALTISSIFGFSDDADGDVNAVYFAEHLDAEISVSVVVAAPAQMPADKESTIPGPPVLSQSAVRAVLYDHEQEICTLSVADAEDEDSVESPPGFPGGYPATFKYKRMALKGHVVAPRKWSHERVALYTLVLELYNVETTHVYHVEGCRVGFREVSIEDGVLKLNGRPIVVAGVNRHEHDPYTGKLVSEESMRRDIVLLKQHNFTAVRACHYPNNRRWYELCDEYGLLVLDEANCEAHGFVLTGMASLAMCDPLWKNEVIGRVAAMYERTKNHACVTLLSLGNECGYGPNTKAAFEWLRPRTTLPIQYENGAVDGDCSMLEGDGRQPIVTDVICPMYDSPAQIAAIAAEENRKDGSIKRQGQRPIILCEYGHAMGNSGGGLNVYWDLVWSGDRSKGHQRVQGGFIWDLVDQGLVVPKKPLPHGVLNSPAAVDQWKNGEGGKAENEVGPYWNDGSWGYGGSFGPDSGVRDRQFCCNGLVFPDRTPHPTMAVLKQLTAPIVFEDLDPEKVGRNGRDITVRYRNRYCFRSLSHVEFRYEVLVGEKTSPLVEGVVSGNAMSHKIDETPLYPGESSEFLLDLGLEIQNVYKEGAWLKVQARMRTNACGGMPAGHTIAERVYSLSPLPQASMVRGGPTADSTDLVSVQFDPTSDEYTVKVPGVYQATIGKSGTPSFSFSGHTSPSRNLVSSMKFLFYRPCLDNDLGGIELLSPGWRDWYRYLPRSLQRSFSYGTQWRGIGLNKVTSRLVASKYDPDTHTVALTENHMNPSGEVLFVTLTHFVFRSSHVRLDVEVRPKRLLGILPTLPRIGVEMKLPELTFGPQGGLIWCGGGPQEEYPDRKRGMTGVFGPLKVDGRDGGKSGGGLHTPYIYPSDSGQRTDVEWVAVGDPAHKAGLLVAHSSTDEPPAEVAPASGMGQWDSEGQADEAEAKKDSRYAGRRKKRPAGCSPGACTISASRYTVDEMDAAKLHVDLPRMDSPGALYKRKASDDPNLLPADCVYRPINLRIDTAYMGIGGDTSWCPQTHDQFLIHPLAEGTERAPGKWTFSLYLKPIPEEIYTSSGRDMLEADKMRERVYAFVTGEDSANRGTTSWMSFDTRR